MRKKASHINEVYLCTIALFCNRSGANPTGVDVTVRSIITPSIIFAAGSIASAANAATTIDTDYAPSTDGTPIILAGGFGSFGTPQFTFDDTSSINGETGERAEFKSEINATDFDPSAGVFYQFSSTTLPDADDGRFSDGEKVAGGNGSGNGNYALRFTGGNTLYTGYATVISDGDGNVGGLIDSITFEAAAVPAVPEPSTWAMMILGLGLVGSEMRRRRRQSRSLALAA